MQSHAPVRELFVQVLDIGGPLGVLGRLMFQRTRMERLEEGGVEIVAGNFGVEDAPGLDVADGGEEKLEREQRFLEERGG